MKNNNNLITNGSNTELKMDVYNQFTKKISKLPTPTPKVTQTFVESTPEVSTSTTIVKGNINVEVALKGIPRKIEKGFESVYEYTEHFSKISPKVDKFIEYLKTITVPSSSTGNQYQIFEAYKYSIYQVKGFLNEFLGQMFNNLLAYEAKYKIIKFDFQKALIERSELPSNSEAYNLLNTKLLKINDISLMLFNNVHTNNHLIKYNYSILKYINNMHSSCFVDGTFNAELFNMQAQHILYFMQVGTSLPPVIY